MLEGKELLEKAKLLSKQSENEIAKGCGYVGPGGRVCLLYTSPSPRD